MAQPGSGVKAGPVPETMKDIVIELKLHKVGVQAWNYIVKPSDSPATSGEGPNMPTCLSPLIQKINLKRKYEGEHETYEDEGVEQIEKKHKGMKEEGHDGKIMPRGRGRARKERQSGSTV